MKKKILMCFLSFTLLFSGLNYKRVHANPIVLGKVAEVSIIYSIGKLAFNTIGLVGSVSDMVDLGGTIFSKMTDEEKNSYKDSVTFSKNGYTYSDNSSSFVSSYFPSTSGNHIMTGINKTFNIDTLYIGSSDNSIDYFDSNKTTIRYQGHLMDFLVTAKSTSKGRNITFQYKFSHEPLSSVRTVGTVFKSAGETSKPYITLFTNSIYANGGNIRFEYWYNGVRTYADDLAVKIPSTCSNCPHDISLNKFNSYPSSSELELIEKEFPQYENDIPNFIGSGDSSEGDDPEGDDPEGDDPEGDDPEGDDPEVDDPEGDSSTIINPPKFPNLEEFSFSALDLEQLTNLFSNFKTKFPFSLPFDLVNLISGLNVDPVPPRFEAEVLNFNFVIDFTEFEELASLVRMFTMLSYVVSLIFITKKFGG